MWSFDVFMSGSLRISSIVPEQFLAVLKSAARDRSFVGVCTQVPEPVQLGEREVLHGARPFEGWASAGRVACADGPGR